ncbi:hypothetical protein DFH09DRAFT_1131730 [Mycena vulgaris]|nr:hypothetical protein DFH09DRAFT_1131730 [Mycena vulgaris]
MFFHFYDQPGLHLPPHEQANLRKELLEIAHASLDPVPDYQCLSSDPDALEDKLIIVAYTGTEEDAESKQVTDLPRAVAFTSAVYLDVPNIEHAVMHTGLTVAVPSLQRTGILMQLFVQLFQNVMPLHPRGMWVTTLAAVLSSLVQSEKVLYNTHPCPPYRLQTQLPEPLQQHLDIARTIDVKYRHKLLISPEAVFDEAMFVFRGSLDWDQAACFKKDVDDVRFWHRDGGSNEYFRGLMRPGKGDEVLLVGFIDADRIWNVLEERRLKARL